jgi:hypothetical protein
MEMRNVQQFSLVVKDMHIEAEKCSADLNVVKGFKVEAVSKKRDFKCGGGGGGGDGGGSGGYPFATSERFLDKIAARDVCIYTYRGRTLCLFDLGSSSISSFP